MEDTARHGIYVPQAGGHALRRMKGLSQSCKTVLSAKLITMPCPLTTESKCFVVRRAAVKEASCFAHVRHRSRELSKHYGHLGVKSGCHPDEFYALVLVLMARTTTSRLSPILDASCTEVHDTNVTGFILLSLERTRIGLVLHT